MNIDNLFRLLDNNFLNQKIEKNRKDERRTFFLEKIENAKNNVHLFGLNFPNFITNSENKIHKTLKHLDNKKSELNIFIYIPTNKIKYQIEKLNIYEKKLQPSSLKRDIYKIQDFKNDFKI